MIASRNQTRYRLHWNYKIEKKSKMLLFKEGRIFSRAAGDEEDDSILGMVGLDYSDFILLLVGLDHSDFIL